MKGFSIITILIFLVGCASTQKLETASFEKSEQENKLVPVNLFIDDGTYNSGNAYPFDHHIFKRFKESEIFYKVGTQSGAWPYTLLVEFDSTSNNSTADDVAFIASAATLFLLPTKSDFTFTLKVSVVSESVLVKQYRYEDVRTWAGGLWDASGKYHYEAIDNLLNHFFNELQNDKILPDFIITESDSVEQNQNEIDI